MASQYLVANFGIQAHSQPVFSGKPEGPFCQSCTFIFRNERNWKKSARVSGKLVSSGLLGLQVAMRLISQSMTNLYELVSIPETRSLS